MALQVGTNSYITAADADLYFEDFLGADAWIGAIAAERDKALITATRRIDRLSLVGKKADEAQALQFPRCYMIGAYPVTVTNAFDLRYATSGNEWECQAEVPRSVLDAVCEEALEILKSAGDEQAALRGQLQRQGVMSIKLGSTSETYGATGSVGLLSEEAEALLKPYLAASGGIG